MRIPSRIRNIVRIGACLLGCLSAFVVADGLSSACAQPAPFDSLRATGFHPTYSTAFKVFKAKRDWTQSLNLNQRFGEATLNTTLDSNSTRDEDQNDLELDSSGILNKLTYSLIGGLNVGIFADLDRSKRLSRTSDLKSTTDVFRLTSGYQQTLVDSALTVSVDGQAGLRQSETNSTLKAGSTGTRDRTRQEGPSVQIAAGLTNSRPFDPPAITFDLDVSADAFRQETDQRNDELAGDFTTVIASSDSTFKSTNSNRAANARLGWTPVSALELDLSVGQRVTRQVRPQPRQAALENTEGDDKTATLTGRWQPRDDLDITVQLDVRDSDKTSNLTTSSNRTQARSGYSVDLGYTFYGIRLDAMLEQNTEETDYKPLATGSSQIDQSRDYIHTQVRAERVISKQITLNLTFDMSLDQSFFDDGILDVDRQDRTTDVALTYKPFASFTGRLSFTEDRQRAVNLHPSRAGNTSTQQRATVGAGYTYTIWRGIRLAQDLSVNAQSRTFDFNDEDQSDLTRNNRLQTTIGLGITRKVDLSFRHSYNFRNSGQFALDDRNIRVFTLNREFTEQRLNVKVTYDPLPWLSFSGDQLLRAVVNRSPGEEGVRTTQYELELFGQLNKKLMDAVQANLRVTRALSTREDFFWRVDMTASRTF